MSMMPARRGFEARMAAKREVTETRLAAIAAPESGAAWLAEARQAARARVVEATLPDRRDEYFRYTDPSRLTFEALPAAAAPATDGELFSGLARLRIVFRDGQFDAAASDALEGEGLEITALSEAGADHWAASLYGALELAGQTPVARPLAALNTATAAQGMLIRVTGQVSKPVAFIYERSGASVEASVHHVVKLEAGAELTLLETGALAARSSSVIEADLADGAALHHVRVQGAETDRLSTAFLFARVGAEGQLRSFTLSAEGALTRNETVVRLDGAKGLAHLAGAALGGRGMLHDDTVFITHGAPECESRQVFKKVLREGAIGVFQGKILVDQIAQLTDGYQISQGLLLDEDCQFLAKPELEIYADDVKCSHGSTAGELDAQQLYYLRARGIPEAEAKALLVLAFLGEALDEIAREDVVEEIRERLEIWLRRPSAVQGA